MHSPPRPEDRAAPAPPAPTAPPVPPPDPLGPLASTLRDVLGCLGVITAAVLISLLCVHLGQAFPGLAAK
ncbi:hypothetical protein GCM10010324_07860 [Streptomyces hiroshimensis]|uniref:Uncharacterized protein n=1 Tax=Streptomyces hiroshimensis TaxID=66424 RepID=A0ABQ2Y4V3_9ACTN|nr:hypothetical protein GCM10010324_07860 [Streptomyces hiroshimensis]